MHDVRERTPESQRARDRGGAARLAGFCLSALLATLGCAGADDEAGPRAGPGGPGGAGDAVTPPVEVVRARAGALPLEETLNGVVRALNQVAIQPEITAPIVEVMVRTGDTVERGQALVRLEDDALRDQLREAEANVSVAEASAAEARARVAELEARTRRTRALAAEDLISEMDLETLEAELQAARAQADQAAARVEQARATLEEQRSALSKTTVRAPISGRVGRRNAEVGMLANPSTTLFIIGDFEDLIVEVPLTERMLGSIREGMPVRIRPRGSSGMNQSEPTRPIEAELSRISPFLERESFSTVAEIDVDNSDAAGAGRLRPGMFVAVDILYGESERATLVPTAALWEDPRTSIQGIYVVRGLSGDPAVGELSEETYPVEFRRVEVVGEGHGRLGVAGVEEGDWVVTVGQQLLPAGGDSGGEQAEVHVRAVTWDRVIALQGLQTEDVLRAFMDKQRRTARERGAEIPSLSAMEIGASDALEPDESAASEGPAGPGATARPRKEG